MNYLVMSDIHGQYEMFSKLYDKIKNIEAQFIFLGDYIDRGEKSKECIDLLVEIKKEKPDTILLKGNHEKMLIDFFKLPEDDQNFLSNSINWIYRNGGIKTLKSFGFNTDDYLDSMINKRSLINYYFEIFFEKLELYYQTDKLFFVHAGVNLDKPFELNTEEDFLWIRPPFKYTENCLGFNKKIIHGHTCNKEVFSDDTRICIDTGCHRKEGKLSAILLDSHGTILDIFEEK